MTEALGIVDRLVESDLAPEWGMILHGADVMHKIITGYLR